ncbi:MAG TPA: NAD-dependent succinate-semialdehyde dehydrogenase [Bryobacteraceae bacterium]|jgi:succinate-semialdehyde dehydrogenase/glutarate-semialdehyde dehydrogenase|nr:NAD-dependent succinate-semialdehyde dehydrogenase [Bryobacteraceae bacterium]
MAIRSVNPASGQLLKEYEPLTEAAIERKLELARQAFHSWKQTPFSLRREAMQKAAEILERDKQQLATVATTEMGKTLASAVAEVEKCALGCRYYAENAERHLAAEETKTNASHSYRMYQPLGPILAVMPWNFPYWQVFRFAAPALMAGNVGLLKHASNVPGCALAIERVFLEAGFPEGVFQTLLLEAERTGKLLEDDRVAAATLTGSEPAGRSIAKIAGSQLKKTVLELGGSDPFVVMPSAMDGEIARTAAGARCINNGQSCIAAKRFLVADSIYQEFERQFVEAMKALRVGDPMDPKTDIGPLATEKIVSELDEQVKRAKTAGATVLTGGKRIPHSGNYYEPTVLTGVPRGSDVFYEELFGPVAMLFRVRDAQDAIELANDSPFGLGASVWTRDEREQELFINGIETGQVFVNATVASDPRMPFGGVKRSGYGRELADIGIREFVNTKTIWIR